MLFYRDPKITEKGILLLNFLIADISLNGRVSKQVEEKRESDRESGERERERERDQ